MKFWLLVVLGLLPGMLMSAPARADELRPGYLALTQRDAAQWEMIWKAPVLGGLATRAHPRLPAFCHASPPQARIDGAALVTLSDVTCARPLAGAEVGLEGIEVGFTDALVRIAPLGSAAQAERLTQHHTAITVASVPSRWEVARTYLLLGVEHILTGYDHLLFVVSLVLLLGELWVVVRAATAFTIAHSLTLAGTTLGLIGLAQAPVEALIALSIVFLAVEVVKLDPAHPRLSTRVPWLVAFGFGLIHGFGFAGALREIGLPEGEVPVALATFNVGVEFGQLLIVGATLAVLAALRRWAPAWRQRAVLVASYAIGTTASFWFLQRLIG